MILTVFDIDGTLTKIQHLSSQCFKDAFEVVFGINIQSQKWGDLKHVTDWGISKEILAREANREVKPEELKLLEKLFVALLKKTDKKYKPFFSQVRGSGHFFDFLRKSQEYDVAIATGSWTSSAKIKLSSAGITHEGVPLEGSDHFFKREDIVLNAVKQAQKYYNRATYKKVVYFGDGLWDLKTCQQLKMPFIGIDDAQNDKLKTMGATSVFPDFSKPGLILEAIHHQAT